MTIQYDQLGHFQCTHLSEPIRFLQTFFTRTSVRGPSEAGGRNSAKRHPRFGRARSCARGQLCDWSPQSNAFDHLLAVNRLTVLSAAPEEAISGVWTRGIGQSAP